MWEAFLHKTKIVLGDEVLRMRILFVLSALVVFRLLATIPIPGIDAAALQSFLNNNQFFGLLNIFSGGGFSNLSIMMLGVGPYITASIVMQLMTILVPKLKEMYQEEGDAGRMRFAQYSRYLSIPLSILQGTAFLFLLRQNGIVPQLDLFGMIVNVAVIAAGSMLLMWIGELITEFGVGNGLSLIIFAGIVSRIPSDLSQLLFAFDVSQLPAYLGFLAVAIAITAGVVFITEAERPIPVTYARRVRGSKVLGGVSTYLPLRVNQAGVIPIIFALSILLFPQIFSNLFLNSSHAWLKSIATSLSHFRDTTLLYGAIYFLLVFVFTYFYTSVTFDPKQMAENLQKNGAFVPGIRPGESTTAYISNIVTRITLVGGLFLGIVAILPLIMRNVTGITSIALGGTAVLIVVSVVIDLLKKIDSQTSMREY